MQRVDLRRVLRTSGATTTLVSVLDALAEPGCVVDLAGTVVLGDPSIDAATAHRVVVDQECVGEVRGGVGAAAVVQLLVELLQREREKRGLVRETLDRYKEISLLYGVAEKLTGVLDAHQIADIVLDEALRVLRGAGGAVLLFDHRTRQLEVLTCRGPKAGAPEFSDIRQVSPDRGILGRVYRTGQAEVVDDLIHEPDYKSFDEPVRSALCAPLRGGVEILGVLRFTSQTPQRWTAGDLKLVTSLATHAAAAMDNALLHRARMRHQRLASHLERYVSPLLLRAALADADHAEVVVLFTDLRQLDRTVIDADAALDTRSAVAIHVVLSHGGAVNRVAGDMLVAVFPGSSRKDCALRAIAAGRALAERLDALEIASGVPAIGISTSSLGSRSPVDLREPITCAASLQSSAQGGQVRVDRATQQCLHFDVEFAAVRPISVGDRTLECFEVVS